MLSAPEVKAIFEAVKNRHGWQADIDVEVGEHAFVISISGGVHTARAFQIPRHSTAEEVRKDAEQALKVQP